MRKYFITNELRHQKIILATGCDPDKFFPYFQNCKSTELFCHDFATAIDTVPKRELDAFSERQRRRLHGSRLPSTETLLLRPP
jgi:hypothetical protein